MAKGFLSGVVRGGLVSLAAAAVASVLAEGPRAPAVSDAAPGAGPGAEPVQPAPGLPKAGSGADRVPVTGAQAPKAPAPAPDTLGAMAGSDMAPTAQPVTGPVEGLAGPDLPPEQPNMAMPADSQILPNPQAKNPMAPAAESGPVVSTEPAAPPAPPPAPVQPSDAAAPEQPADPVASGTAAAPAEPAGQAAPAMAMPAAPLAPATETEALADVAVAARPAAPEAPAATPPAASIAAPADTPGPADEPAVIAALAPAEPEPGAAPDAPPAEPEAAPPAAPEPQAAKPSALPTIGAAPEAAGAATGGGIAIGSAGGGVVVNRLPALTGEAPAEGTGPEAAEAPVGDAAQAGEPPIVRYAAPFENPEGKPLMAIVLMDLGSDLGGGPVGLEALGSFPYPISFAVDASLPDAAERMHRYRDEGFEVLALLDLPEGATAADAEISVAAAFEAVPEAVALMEGTGNGVQTTRGASDQVTAILAGAGRGFVTQNRGLNTVQKLADKAGVPSAAVFRDFDAKDQKPTVIRRFLDQAAFRAGQEGAVIMLGRVRADTISALLIWGLQDRAEKVALVPVSAVLKGGG